MLHATGTLVQYTHALLDLTETSKLNETLITVYQMDTAASGAHSQSPDDQLTARDGSPRGYGVRSDLMAQSHASDVETLRPHSDGTDLYDGAAHDRFDPGGINTLSGAGIPGTDSAQAARFEPSEIGGADQACLGGDGVALSRAVDATTSGLVESTGVLEQSSVTDGGGLMHMHTSLSTLVNSDYAAQLPASSYQMLQERSVNSMNLDGTSAALDANTDQGDCDRGYEGELREQDRFLPIANVARIMKRNIPKSGKISKDAKECVQECVSEFISFITSEASERCQQEKRKTINGDDILYAMQTLGFDSYMEPLKLFLHKYREFIRGERGSNPSQVDSMADELEETADNHTMSGAVTTPTGQAFLPPGLMAEQSGSSHSQASVPIFTTQYGQITQAMSY